MASEFKYVNEIGQTFGCPYGQILHETEKNGISRMKKALPFGSALNGID